MSEPKWWSAPIVRLALNQATRIRRLREDLAAERERNRSLLTRLGVALRERDQAVRDADLVVAMTKDPATARAFLSTKHTIDQLPEGA